MSPTSTLMVVASGSKAIKVQSPLNSTVISRY